MLHLAIILWAMFAAWRWGDWRNWKNYHSTMLFMPFSNLIYSLLVNDRNFYLWRYQTEFLLSVETADLFHCLITFPATVLLFLSNYPEQRGKQILHILKYVSIYIAVEIIALQIGAISHTKGWSIWWSLWFNCVTFPVLRLHHTHPLRAYAVSMLITAYLLWYFDVPLQDLE